VLAGAEPGVPDPARSNKAVSVGPGITAVTVTPLSRSSWATATAKESANDRPP